MRLPKLKKDSQGRKYVKIGTKRYYPSKYLSKTKIDRLSERGLILELVKVLLKKPKRRKNAKAATAKLSTAQSQPEMVPKAKMEAAILDPGVRDYLKLVMSSEAKYQNSNSKSLEAPNSNSKSLSEKKQEVPALEVIAEEDEKEPKQRQLRKKFKKVKLAGQEISVPPGIEPLIKAEQKRLIRRGNKTGTASYASAEKKQTWYKDYDFKDLSDNAKKEGYSGHRSGKKLNDWIDKHPESEIAKLRQKEIDEYVKEQMEEKEFSPIESEEAESESSEYEEVSENEVEKPHIKVVDEKSQDNNQNQLSPNNPLPMGGLGKNRIPDEGLSTDEINKLMAHRRSYLTTVPRDYIGRLSKFITPGKTASFIANLDPHDKPGLHWVAVVLNPKKARVMYFDSFGKPCPEDIRKQIKKLVKVAMPGEIPIFKENLIKVQRVNSVNCGPFAMKFIEDIMDGKPFVKATPYDESLDGEKVIKRYIAKLPKFDTL